jgi:trimethylamine--corrinoid protein Co-methyltransferase
MTLLSQEEKERIQGRAQDILQEVGIKFDTVQALDILADAGCDVDASELSAKIPAHLVEKALSTTPGEFTLAGRSTDRDQRFGSGETLFISAAQSVFYRDLESRQRRESTLADLIDCTVMCDALEEIDLFCPMVVPNDVHPYMRGLKAGQAALMNTDKHLVGGVGSVHTLPFHLEIWDAILGDRARMKERPFMSHIINDVSPLQKDGDLVETTLALREYQVPILLYYMPMAGSTSPVTLSGTLLEMTANMLSSVVLYQLAEPGWPIIWGAGPGVLDMRTGRFAAEADAALISVAQVEMAAHFGLPSVSGWIGSFESKEIGFQSGLDSVLGVVPVALTGADGVWGPGDLDGSNLVDLPFLFLGAEVVRQLKRLVKGIDLDDEHLLFEVIEAMRFQGEYLGDPSTKKYFRQEHMMPQVFPRESFENWEARSESEEEMAVGRVQSILRTHRPRPLAHEVSKEIQRIVTAAEKVLAV